MMEASGLPPNYQHAIEWLQAPPESKKIYERHLTTGLPGTANWIFEEVRYQEWLHATGRNTLWIFGPREPFPNVSTSSVYDWLLTTHSGMRQVSA
jgi:hypothetical protein